MSGARINPYPKSQLQRIQERRKKGVTRSQPLAITGTRRAPLHTPAPLPTGDKRWLNQNAKDLSKALLAINTEEEMLYFLRDLLTPAEISEFGNRWKAARMLASGESYTKVGFETFLSSRTIRRIKRWLTEGMGGYELAVRRIKKTGVE